MMQFNKVDRVVSWYSALYSMLNADSVFWSGGLFYQISLSGIIEYSDGSKYDEWEESTNNFQEFRRMTWYETEENSDI